MTRRHKKKSKTPPESDEEIEETSSEKTGFLSGKVIAFSGKLSMPREKAISIIEKNGGTYAKTITKDVTHVICSNVDDKTKIIQKAKEEGKILVDVNFFNQEHKMNPL